MIYNADYIKFESTSTKDVKKVTVIKGSGESAKHEIYYTSDNIRIDFPVNTVPSSFLKEDMPQLKEISTQPCKFTIGDRFYELPNFFSIVVNENVSPGTNPANLCEILKEKIK